MSPAQGSPVPESYVFAERAGVALSGDLYRPAGPGPHPVLVASPGGGWLRNQRQQFAAWGGYLASQGFAVFAIDYSRSDKGPSFPANLEDVWAAIDFVRSRGGEFGLDASRLGLLGASAGAHLSALAALTGEARGVEVLVLAYGVYDLFDHWDADRWRYSGPGSDLTERMLGATPHEDPERYFAASPRLQATSARASRLKAMLLWGDADDVVLPRQSEGFARTLEQAGAVVRTEAVAGAGHFWFSSEPPTEPGGRTAAVAPRIVRFLKQHLG
jgi:acetyl esterase/lipase